MSQSLETNIKILIRKLFGSGFQLRPVPSETSTIFIAEFGENKDSLVIKLARDATSELQREQRILDELDALQIPVPTVLYTQENHPFNNRLYTITRYIPGPDMDQVIRWNDQRTHRIFTQIALVTRQLTTVSLEQIPDAFPPEQIQADELQWWEDNLEIIARNRNTTRLLEQVYHAARGIMLNLPSVFGHRDGVQCVTDGEKVFLVDVGAAGANWPDADFARALYACCAWHHGLDFPVWREALQTAYLEGRDLNDADAERIIIFMVYYALRDAAHYASIGKNNRVNRLFNLAEFLLMESRKWFGK